MRTSKNHTSETLSTIFICSRKPCNFNNFYRFKECVPKHKLLVMDMQFKATKSWHRKFEPRVRVWKLKEEKTCEEYRCIVGDKVEEAK